MIRTGGLMLKFDGEWRFDSPGPLPQKAVGLFLEYVGKIRSPLGQKETLEHFGKFFSDAAGQTFSSSSSIGWAETDLSTYADNAADNAALFIEAFVDACSELKQRHPETQTPSERHINNILEETQSGYYIKSGTLFSSNTKKQLPDPEKKFNLNEEAHIIVQESLEVADSLLRDGRNRQAVQEILWLLETVSTGFTGVENDRIKIKGKYFSQIIKDIRNQNTNVQTQMILKSISELYGFLSSPKGGGIRHGSDISNPIYIDDNQARLYCNLIRSYIWYLLEEHKKIFPPT